MLKGSIVALVTPFDKNGSVDEERLESLINWHIKNSTDGILVCGTTGESATLTYEEHKRIIEFSVEIVNKRVPLIAGCGSNSTHEALDLTQHAKEKGADYALIITPYYNKPTQEGLYLHFSTIANKINIPIIIYNVPSRTGVNILPETVARLYKECKNIIGIKEASGSLEQITKIMTLVDDKFILLSGSDEVTLPILSVGGKGVISVLANIMPKETHNLIESYLKGEVEKARQLQIYLFDIIKGLFIETNPIPVKYTLERMGLIEGNLRLPLCPLSKDNQQKLDSLLKRYKLI